MILRNVAIFFSFCVSCSPALAQKWIASTVEDVLVISNKEVIKGYLASKLNASYNNRILAQDEPKLIEPFKQRTEERCWQTEFWGKWFTSAALAYRYHPEPKLKALLDKAVSDLISTQTADGYIGNYTEAKRLQQWDIWGRKYCLLGLIAYHDITGDAKSLGAAQKLTDHLIKELADKKVMLSRQGNHRGMAATSTLEPVCLLYARTGNKKYLDFAEEIVQQWETSDGPQLISKASVDVAERFPKPKNWWDWEQGQKAYEMMSCYEGLLELYRITGKSQYKEAVEKTWENIKNTEINLAGSGSSVECWFGAKELQVYPVKKYQETCVTATWIKLSQQLLRLTGEAKYADAIEQSYYNALLGSMTKDGADWAKYSPLQGMREEGEEQCGMGINCCVASGPRGLFTLPHTIVMQSKKGASINFFAEGSYEIVTPKRQRVELVQQSNYPADGKVSIKLKLPKQEQFILRIRIPEWSRKTSLLINQEAVSVTPGSYAEIDRIWKNDDEIKVDLDMRGRVISMGQPARFIAIMRGPLLLSRDVRLDGPNLNENLTPVLDKDGTVALQPVPTTSEDIWLQYKANYIRSSSTSDKIINPVVPVVLCDYSSAGNTLNEKSLFTVWLPQLIDPAAKEN